ncbi:MULTISPECIES: ATP-binding protein [unclassified Aureimonas]|uniref:ATP-binding protein n=1 Tax=unclassified Aureimonas TaxID=2615206 RepID=UPI0006F579AE|nr:MULTISPECIES: ATP-binding protein [unclassified Aureimonas]KQT58546.1 hypothetical protein ASG62_24630 [Aureimonas sp. Leaf427]KQT65149.1 hypothetical protein ASG54_22695 [Aureimonas sp. Leaf460]
MTPTLVGGKDEVVRTTRATWASLASSVILLALLLAAYANLAARSGDLQDGIREDALWAVYQVGRESASLSATLRDALDDGSAEAAEAEALGLRYDILFSRMGVLEGAKYGSYFADDGEIRGRRAEARRLIAAMQPTFDALRDGKADLQALHAAASATNRLVSASETLLLRTNAAVSAARADARAELLRLQDVTAWIVLALVVSVGMLVFSLCRRLRATHVIGERIQVVVDEMRKAFAAAEAGNRAKSEFMATMGHEIRTPLNAILGMSELLAMSDLSADDRESVAAIGSSGAALLEVINEILDFTKIEHGDLVSERVPFDPAELVREATVVANVRALERGNSILFERTEVSGYYEGDPARLRRVLLNLLSNAAKFTENGCIRVSLREVGTPESPRLRFDVIDNGIGIAREARPLLFRPFSQVDGSISRRFGGTGLGLAICKRVVEAAGGEIGVDSAPGVGSRFWFEVPADRAEAAPAPETFAADGLGSSTYGDVLVVEDNAFNRRVAARFLERLGHRATFAENGEAAVALAVAGTFDLILMDMHMPVMDGIESTRRIRAAGVTAPIVALTANASESDRERCASAGMDGFETKPIPMDRLRALVDRWCGDRVPAGGTETASPAPAAGNGEAADDMPELDGARVADLVAALGEDGLAELQEEFRRDARDLLTELSAAFMGGDAATADRVLHTIKGAAFNVGYRGIAALAEQVRAGSGDAALERLESELGRVSSDGMTQGMAA